MVAGPVDPRLAAMMQMVREMRKQVEETADYVGDQVCRGSPQDPL